VLAALTAVARRRTRLVIGLAVLFSLLASAGATSLTRVMRSDRSNLDDPASQSVTAEHVLDRLRGASVEPDVVALVRTWGPRVAGQLAHVRSALSADPAVARVASRATRAGAVFAAYFHPLPEPRSKAAVVRIEHRLGPRAALLGGPAVAEQQIAETISSDLKLAELVAFPLLFALSLFVFRGLVAAALPVIVGWIAIAGASLGLRAVAALTPLSIFALNLITGVGLGLAIDYSLLIVSRYREELHLGRAPGHALVRTMRSAGRTVAFSSITVAAAMATLFAFPQRFLYSMAVGGMLVSLIAGLAALLVLPAVLTALGHRVDSLKLRRLHKRGDSRAWYVIARTVMRRAAPIALASATLLVALGIPFARVRFVGIDTSVLPSSASAREVASALPPSNDPLPGVVVAVSAQRHDYPLVARYAASLRRIPGVEAVAQPLALGAGAWQIDLQTSDQPLGPRSRSVVRLIRSRGGPFPVRVSGEAAHFVDEQSSLAAHLPLALSVLAATTALLLFALTRSLLIPLKAILVSALGLTAALGVLVLIFQDGRFERLLGYTSQRGLESTEPIVLSVIAFALATDYGIFLFSRIREERDNGLPNEEAIAVGLQRTGRIVTSAALLFCVAIGAFAISRLVFIKELGLGTAIAVAIDATLIRAVLVPSLMKLLGEANWWLPNPSRWLERRGRLVSR
jgi:uncharacterized membrane protein YdfJ with MMPL/SSD domain